MSAWSGSAKGPFYCLQTVDFLLCPVKTAKKRDSSLYCVIFYGIPHKLEAENVDPLNQREKSSKIIASIHW